jgi:hypothetical protein
MDYIFSRNLSEVRELLARPPVDPNDASHRVKTKDDRFFGSCLNFPDCVVLATQSGLPKEAADLEEAAQRYQTKIANQHHESIDMTYDVCGSSLDVGRFLSGEPECLLAFNNRENSKIVKIAIDIGYNCHINADTVLARGRAIYSMVRALELKGYSVGISLFVCSSNDTHTFSCELRLREPGEFLDPAIVAFYIIHPSAFRRVFFRMQEEGGSTYRNRVAVEGGWASYGSSCQLHKHARDQWYGSDNAVVFPKILENETSQSIWETRALELIKTQGIELES